MTLDQLEILIAVVEQKSFLAASEAIHRSRPALSIAIKNLEEELGVPLFLRDKIRPRLTPQGKILYKEAQRIVNQTTHFKTLAKRLAGGMEPEITVVVNALCPLPAAMTVLHLFQSDHPFTQLNVNVEYGEKALELLLEGKADLVLTELKEEYRHLEAIPWKTIELIPVATPAHPLAAMERELQYEDIVGYTQIVVKGSTEDLRLTQFSKETFGHYLRVDDFYIQKQLLLSFFGWGFMPLHLIEEEIANGSLKPLLINGLKKRTAEISLIRRTDRPLGPQSKKIWGILC